MILNEIISYIRKHKIANPCVLSKLFKVDKSVVENMLLLLEQKHLINKLTQAQFCGKACGNCNIKDAGWYSWRETENDERQAY